MGGTQFKEQLCIDMGMDMGIDMCTNMCIDMCTDMGMDMCTGMSTGICTDMCTGMCTDMCTGMCTDMCTGMCTSILTSDTHIDVRTSVLPSPSLLPNPRNKRHARMNAHTHVRTRVHKRAFSYTLCVHERRGAESSPDVGTVGTYWIILCVIINVLAGTCTPRWRVQPDVETVDLMSMGHERRSV